MSPMTLHIDWSEILSDRSSSPVRVDDLGPEEGSTRGHTRRYRSDPPQCRPRAVAKAPVRRPVTNPAAKAVGACDGEGPSAPKKSRSSDTEKEDVILHMLEELNKSVQASLKSAKLQHVSKEASPEEIFEALKAIPKLARADLLRAYSMLTCDDRQFRSLMALPMSMRKDWLLMEIGNK